MKKSNTFQPSRKYAVGYGTRRPEASTFATISAVNAMVNAMSMEQSSSRRKHASAPRYCSPVAQRASTDGWSRRGSARNIDDITIKTSTACAGTGRT